MKIVAILASVAAAAAGYTVDGGQSSFRDEEGRQRLWHGVNFVNKGAPFYPTISSDDVSTIKSFGSTVVRLGVMMPGLFPKDLTPDASYLDKIEELVEMLHSHGLDTILDLHQDVLAPKICGEGTPDWMLDIASLEAMALPRPLALKAMDIDPDTGRPKSCSPVGPLNFLGWSEWYMTDQCGKAFQQLYDGKGKMAEAFDAYWKTVATRFKGKAGVLAYELLNEPWVGDHVAEPLLILEGGKAEKEVAKFMQRAHDVVRSVDNDTLVLYAPAEVNNRAMRSVGYEQGFLPEAGMAYHVYCVVGTDGDGPTNPILKELCHLNDGFSMKQRESDLRRLHTAGFVTEFGAVNPSESGLAEVEFVLEHFDAMQPPTSWAFWDFNEIVGHDNKTQVEAYLRTLARPYPTALAGDLQKMSFDGASSAFQLQFQAKSGGTSEIFLPKQRRYANGFNVAVEPQGALEVKETDLGLELLASVDAQVTVSVTAKASALV